MIPAVNSSDKIFTKDEIEYSYFKYWNPYRRILEIKGEESSFFGSTYFKVSYNKNNRIKTVTRIDQDKSARETYHFLWSKSGLRSEYKIKFQ